MIDAFTNSFLWLNTLLGENLVLTLVVIALGMRVISQPTLKQTKLMRQIGPLMKEAKEKHGKDPKRLQQEQLKIYREAGINPLVFSLGCFGALITLGLFLLFFFSFPKIIASGIGTEFFGYNLARPDVFRIEGIPFELPGVLVIVTALLNVVRGVMTLPEKKEVKKDPKAQPDFSEALTATSGQFIYFVPIFFLVFARNFASGIVLFYLIDSALAIIQQYFALGFGGLKPWLARIGIQS
jgi:YidC/Oxa1 family membrane protein insertase